MTDGEPVVRAAGGIVCRFRPGGGIEVLLVGATPTDPGYRGFPKGVLKPGEPVEMAALREIREETGFRVQLLALVGISAYRYTTPDGVRREKTVHLYLARPTGGNLSERDGERMDVGWAAVEEARRQLTYEADRELLARALDLVERVPLYRSLIGED
jgi:8-oxo-dGTP pyrophosphatase MutT (NUDIX family)